MWFGRQRLGLVTMSERDLQRIEVLSEVLARRRNSLSGNHARQSQCGIFAGSIFEISKSSSGNIRNGCKALHLPDRPCSTHLRLTTTKSRAGVAVKIAKVV